MKAGRSITELAAELERQLETRKDYVAPQGVIMMESITEPTGSEKEGEKLRENVALSGVNGGSLRINDYAHGQFASHLNIPKVYYDRMREQAPALLADNVNEWLHRDPKTKRMVRTLDGRVRGFLSDRYRSLDNFDLAETTFPVLGKMKAQVISAELTEKRFYIKAIFPDLCENVPAGVTLGAGHDRIDSIIAAVYISNSEVGAGSLRVEAGCFNTWCTNLAGFSNSSMRKYHIGRSAAAELDAAVECFTDATKRADDAAFWMKVRDVVASSCNVEAFKSQVEKMRIASGDRIESEDFPKVIEVTRKKLGLGENLQNGLLKRLIEGQSFTRWGVMNAITRVAEDQVDYDVATDLERVGGQVLELSRSDWEAISQAA